MISKGHYINRYCSEPLNKIENYEEAVASEKKYVVHHRIEDTTGYSKKKLIELGLYFHQPASALIFMEQTAHRQHHMNGNKNPFYGDHRFAGENNPFYGHEGLKGKAHPRYINTDDEMIADLYKSGVIIAEIARRMSVSFQTVKRRLSKMSLL